MKDYKKYYTIPAEPEEIYIALTNPATIQLWTGEKALMSTEPGSEFSLWEDSIVGINLEFEEGKKIVQQWFFEQEEPSIVTIKLHPHKHGTSVELRHTNIPDTEYDDIIDGWDNTYFASLPGILSINKVFTPLPLVATLGNVIYYPYFWTKFTKRSKNA